MRKEKTVLYKNRELMSEYNDMMVRIKMALYYDKESPNVKEIDLLQNRVFEILIKDQEEYKRF